MTHTVYLPMVLRSLPTLKAAFAEHGLQFGFAVNNGSFGNDIIYSIIKEHASMVTTENALKMEYTQPEQGIYNFADGDAIVKHAQALGLDIHENGVMLEWQNPKWLIDGKFDRNQLASILGKHVETLAWHYRDQLVGLDVANEAFAGMDGSLMAGPWQPLNDLYVFISFDSARAANCPVIYNCFSKFEHHNLEHSRALYLLDNEIANGIGIQLHLYESTWEIDLGRTEAFLIRIRDHGGWCRFSEVGVLASNDRLQADVYRAITQLAIKYKDIVKEVITWGVRDPAGFRGNVTLFNNNGEPKPSCHAVMEELS